MLNTLQMQLREFIANGVVAFYPSGLTVPVVEVEVPKDRQHGEFSSNIALKSAKILKRPPIDIAAQIVVILQNTLSGHPLASKIERIEVKPPGFINFYLSQAAVQDILWDIFHKRERYGSAKIGQGQRIQLEFVSANPTGPLSVAHARQAAVGDALGNILSFLGFEVVKEYYVNDEGNQINLLAESVRLQAQKLLSGREITESLPYQGDYIEDIARECLEKKGIQDNQALQQASERGVIREFAVNRLIEIIRRELDDFGVRFDVWSYQSHVASIPQVEQVLEDLVTAGHVYQKEGALWFRSTRFGDDKDRVVRKSDGSFTYLAPDIVYHKNKYERGFQQIINIWGPDHHGYIPRLRAAVQALGYSGESLQVLIVQLATIFRDGQPVSMSTRKGQYIQLREVMDEVGGDVARFFFLLRHLNAHLDFDLELAKKESAENPVYYIQYAHARIHSIFKKAQETRIKPAEENFELLQEKAETSLIKLLGHFSHVLQVCHQELDPYALLVYLMQVATDFHRFYDCHRVIDPAQPKLSAQRLGLIEAVRIVLANGLGMLGISQPQRM